MSDVFYFNVAVVNLLRNKAVLETVHVEGQRPAIRQIEIATSVTRSGLAGLQSSR